MKKLMILLCVFCTMLLCTELPYSFTELAHYDPDNSPIQAKAYDVTVGEDSLIYTAFGEAGIYVHQLIDSNLVYISHFCDGANHRNLLIAYDGSLLSATTSHGIHAYSCTDGQLSEQAILDTNIRTYRMIQGPDSTIFMANGKQGLFAYKFDGSQFDFLTFIDQGGSALGIACRSDSTVFLANYYDGVRLYKFKGSEFIPKGHLKLSEDECYDYHAADIAILNDSTIVSCGSQVNVYHYTDTSLNEIRARYLPVTNWDPYNPYNYNLGERVVCRGDSIFISVKNQGLYYVSEFLSTRKMVNYRQISSHGTFLSNNLIFHANEGVGLSVFDHNFNLIDKTSFSDKSTKLNKGVGNTFFLASGTGGVKALTYQEGSFELLDKIGMENDVVDIAVSENGKIISTVNRYRGLKVYKFLDNKFSLIYSKDFSVSSAHLVQIENLSTDIYSNKIYFGFKKRIISADYQDQYDITTGEIYQYTFNSSFIVYHSEVTFSSENILKPRDVKLDNRGNIFVSFDSKGVKELTHSKVKNDFGSAQAVDISEDGLIYLANGTGGIRLYDFDTCFYEIGHIDNGGYAQNVFSMGNNMVFLANGLDGFRVYTYEDSTFLCKAHFNTVGELSDVIVLDDSTVIVADGYNGIKAFTYNGWNEINSIPILETFELYQNYPNPFNPITTISYKLLAVSNLQLAIYDISGRKIKQWSYTNQATGSYEITWNGKDQFSNQVPSGLYIYTLKAGDDIQSKKMLLLK